MIGEFSEVEDGALLDADLCIVGSGAAGITLARTFIGTSVQVLLVAGSFAGRDYIPLDVVRLRFFGGTTNHWGGWCTTLTPIDFARRDWVPHSGWPIGPEALEPHYPETQDILQLGAFGYDGETWRRRGMHTPYPLDPQAVDWHFWQISAPTRFGQRYRAALNAADNVRVLLHANVTGLRTDPAGAAVNHIDLASLDGRRARVRARAYVLAAGGLENPRLLLLSTDADRRGLGNRHDTVGRFFGEHMHARPAQLLTGDPIAVAEAMQTFHYRGHEIITGLCPSAALQRRLRILNNSMTLIIRGNEDSVFFHAWQIARGIREGRIPDRFGDRLLRLATDFDTLAGGAYRRFLLDAPWPEGEQRIADFGFFIRCEQAPNPDSRVFLGEERDALGLPRPVLDWRLTEFDKRSVREFCIALGNAFGAVGGGRVRLAEWLLDDSDDWGDSFGGSHHVGTTRMSADPRDGVVDADCRVHGMDNLYIAGSSVYPTGGFAHPTYTIVALSLRLAYHLKERLDAA